MSAVEAVRDMLEGVSTRYPMGTTQEANGIALAQVIALAALADNVGRIADALERTTPTGRDAATTERER